MVSLESAVACKPCAKLASAFRTSTSHANAVRQSCLKALMPAVLYAQLLVHHAPRLRTPVLEVDQHPALRQAAVGRPEDVISIAFHERRHRLRLSLGRRNLGLGQGRGDTGDPLAPRGGSLWRFSSLERALSATRYVVLSVVCRFQLISINIPCGKRHRGESWTSKAALSSGSSSIMRARPR